jgi:hypothetical protein
MNRALFLSIGEGEAIAQCLKEKVGLSTIERLPGGGVRLVCASSEGAKTMRIALKSKLTDSVARVGYRPRSPLW